MRDGQMDGRMTMPTKGRLLSLQLSGRPKCYCFTGFKKTRVFSKRPGLFKNPNLVDLGDVLLRFEGYVGPTGFGGL